jgi:hydrogenase expression/formation protein HypC
MLQDYDFAIASIRANLILGERIMCLAVPGKIVSIDGTDPIFRCGKVNFGGILKQINLAYVPEAKIGDYVLVHVGFAISTIDEAEAQQVFAYLRQMEELAELEEAQ